MLKITRILACLLAVVANNLVRDAFAQATYPARPIQFIVGVAPGGLQDLSARVVANYLEKRLGQPVIVVNKPGANTVIGANYVLRAAPDGYTFLFGSAMSPSPIFVKNQPVDVSTQLKPVALVLATPWYLLINKSVPANSIGELIAYAKEHPETLKFADAAPLSTMVMYAIADRASFTFMPIPYKGSAPSLNALVGGEIDVVLDTVPNYLPHIASGKVRALISTSDRLSVLPSVPGLREINGFDFSVQSVQSLWAPPGTPDAVIARISGEFTEMARDKEFKEKFYAVAQTSPVLAGPLQLKESIDEDRALYAAISKKIGYLPN